MSSLLLKPPALMQQSINYDWFNQSCCSLLRYIVTQTSFALEERTAGRKRENAKADVDVYHLSCALIIWMFSGELFFCCVQLFLQAFDIEEINRLICVTWKFASCYLFDVWMCLCCSGGCTIWKAKNSIKIQDMFKLEYMCIPYPFIGQFNVYTLSWKILSHMKLCFIVDR